ncbi:hypothetical protein [Candidatus Uabimicrobium sp. HlEnr_7]|uniref:hypothetical protein n=1 Tax=Candidatus Uabimicrobium helgolandensis TaxID=3095367 RepID=UPI003557A5D3
MEYLYQVNIQDEVLGRIERTEAHQKGILHRAGVVWIFNSKQQVFLSKSQKVFKSTQLAFECHSGVEPSVT